MLKGARIYWVGINGRIRLLFGRCFRLEFQGFKVTTDAGSVIERELDEMMGLTERVQAVTRHSKQVTRDLIKLSEAEQSILSSLKTKISAMEKSS